MADHAGQPEAEQPREDAEPQDLWAEVLRAQEELRRLLAALQQPNVTDDERTTLYAQLAAVTAALGAAVAAPPAAAAALGAAAAAPPAAAAALPAAEHAAPPGSDRRPAERAGRALRRRHLGGHGSDSESVHSDDSVRTEDLQLNLAAVLHGAAELQAAEQQAGVEGPAAEQQVPEAGMAGAAAAAEQQAPEAGMAGAAAAAEQQAPGAGWADAQSPPEQLPAFGQQQAAGQLANELAQSERAWRGVWVVTALLSYAQHSQQQS